MDPSAGGDVFDNAFAALMSPMGMMGAASGLLIAFAALMFRPWRWILLGAALWVCTFAGAAGDGTVNSFLWGPLDLIRANGRLIATGALLGLLLPALTAASGWRSRITANAAIAYLALQLIYSSRILLAGMATRALSSFGIYLLIFVVFSRGLGMWLLELDDALTALRAVALAATAFVGSNALQLLINSSSAIWNGRMHGTAGNPQLMAEDLATFLPPVLFLLLRKEEKKSFRICMAATTGLSVIMLGMTASRTGALMAMVVVVVMFRRWLGKLVKLAVVGCIVTFLGLLLFPDVTIQTDRLTSTTDTRTVVWNALFNDFLNHPVFGYVVGEPSIRESSYLSVAGRLGVIGVIPLTLMIWGTLRSLGDLRRLRPQLGEYALLADMITAGIASIAVGAAFEGFVLGTLTLQVFQIYIYLSLSTFLVDLVAHSAASYPLYEDYEESPPPDISVSAYHF